MICPRCKIVVPAAQTTEGLWCTRCGFVRRRDQEALQVEKAMLRALVAVFAVCVTVLMVAVSVRP